MSTSAISKNDTLYRQSIYENKIDSEGENREQPFDNAIEPPSYVYKLFKQDKTAHIYVEPPPRKTVIEKRLFLLDIICDFVNFRSYWESSLKKLDNLPESISRKKIRKLSQLMFNLSQISREISNKRLMLLHA